MPEVALLLLGLCKRREKDMAFYVVVETRNIIRSSLSVFISEFHCHVALLTVDHAVQGTVQMPCCKGSKLLLLLIFR